MVVFGFSTIEVVVVLKVGNTGLWWWSGGASGCWSLAQFNWLDSNLANVLAHLFQAKS